MNRDVNHFYLKWSEYKTPKTKRPITKCPKQQNAQCNKRPNATKRPITKRPMLQNAQCYITPIVTKRPK